MTDLKLIALDSEDLAVVSAQLQDAVVRVGDLVYLPGEQRFAAVVNRFNWLDAMKQPGDAKFERRQTALRFERVLSARYQGIVLSDKRRVLSLLSVQFTPREADSPDGFVTLVFAAGAAIRLDIECIECEMRDLGAVWATKSKPDHPGAEGGTSSGGNGSRGR